MNDASMRYRHRGQIEPHAERLRRLSTITGDAKCRADTNGLSFCAKVTIIP